MCKLIISNNLRTFFIFKYWIGKKYYILPTFYELTTFIYNRFLIQAII